MTKKVNAKLYNSLSRKLEELTVPEGREALIYHCGPTVYKRAHLGNMRRYLFADFLGRSLDLLGYKTKEIMNITDVGHLTDDDGDRGEDKLEKEARQRQKQPQEIAREMEDGFYRDLERLNIRKAARYPRATDHIKEMQEMIGVLLEKGHAYRTGSGVYFEVSSWPNYGRLSGNTLDKLAAGARVEVRSEKKNPADFALWVLNAPKQIQQWDSPWGRGYPGWHIECSAMSRKFLGETIDIHTGGIDNKFPHHENEIAQSEASGSKPFVRIWMHNGHLTTQGAKIAKREGKQVTLDTLEEEGLSPLAFRLFVFGAHYRGKLELRKEALLAAAENLRQIERSVRKILGAGKLTGQEKPDEAYLVPFRRALADDLNTSKALAVFLGFLKDTNKQAASGNLKGMAVDKAWVTAREMDRVIGVAEAIKEKIIKEKEEIPRHIQDLVERRSQARQANDFEASDQLRKVIEEAGFRLEDTRDGQRVYKTNKP